jgi:putative solute:sodium symporter small subunit
MHLTPEQQAYWRRNLKLTAALLGIWFLATFGVIWFARDLNEISLFGFPLAFYMGAQGALLIYILIIWYYARRMNELDEEYGVREDDV